MTRGIIYYTDNRIGGPIVSNSRKTIKAAGLPITSCSLNRPIRFGDNYVHKGNRSYPTMLQQVITVLKNSKEDYVFFTEHDVLYHETHWDFTPLKDDIYYYNVNNWRWRYPTDRAIFYQWLPSLSQLCCNRELALDHFERRLKRAIDDGLDFNRSREPRWARVWGYEPGTKPTRRGGFSDEKMEMRLSRYPNIDIRHPHTLSKTKTRLNEFKHEPFGWTEVDVRRIPGWDLDEMFDLKVEEEKK